MNDVPQEATQPGPVLLYDGSCGLCNRAVLLLLRADRRGVLRFAPLQGAPAQAWLAAHGLPRSDFDSLVFVGDWTDGAARPALRTDGLIEALAACGFPGGLASALRLVPRGLRDAAYRAVARYRYRVFGAWRPRPLPRAAWAARFIGGDPSGS